MSIVGPRPLPSSESRQCSPRYRQRLDVTPGITGTWQVQGRNLIPFDQWMELDLAYVQQRSLLVDMKVILATVPAVALCRGAF